MTAAGARDGSEQDALLTEVALHGDRAAFAKLFRHYAPRVKGWMLREGCPSALAEELAQETMLLVWQKASLFNDARGGASAWIFTIARNLRIDAVRRERHPSDLMPEWLLEVQPPEQADVALASAQSVSRLRAALRQLPPEQADVVWQAFFGGNAHAGIEKALNIPLGTVKSRLRLAMNRLRATLDDLR